MKLYTNVYTESLPTSINMIEIHFYLKNPPNKDGSCLIFLQMNYYGSNRLKYTFKESIQPRDWDSDRELPKRSYNRYSYLKSRLDREAEATEDTYLEFIDQGIIPTPDELKKAIKAKTAPKPSTAVPDDDLVGYFQQLIKDRDGDPAYAPGTITNYKALLSDLKEYKRSIPMEKIDKKWVQRFQNHLNAKGLEQNTVSKKISLLRMVLNEATEDGFKTNPSYKSTRVKAPRVETTQIYLNEAEIDRFYRVECENIDQEEARDVFVLMAYTGVRISDVDKISARSFFVQDKIEYFRFHQQKVKNPVLIPVHPLVKEILDKYDWKVPTRSRQRFSDHIKVIGQKAGIDQEIDLVKYPGSRMTITQVPKYTQIKTHTARRSLACNMIIAGVPDKIVMAVGGWKSYKSYAVYQRLTADDKLKIASKSNFFNKAKVISMVG